jgi:hypothetical protein
VQKQRGIVGMYRKNPGDTRTALAAAGHYARKYGASVHVVRTNSYMHKVYFMCMREDEIASAIPMPGTYGAYVVDPDNVVTTTRVTIGSSRNG